MTHKRKERGERLILVVDDEPACRIPLEDTLRAAGHEVHVAGAREEAESLVRRFAYDVVVLDNNLSGGGTHEGLDILCAVRGLSRDTKVVIVTGYGSPQVAQAARDLGAVSYLEKPVPLSEMLEVLARLGVRCPADAGA